MKKYNTPEIKVSMFNVESVLTESAALEEFNTYANTPGTAYKQFSWAQLQENGIDVSF